MAGAGIRVCSEVLDDDWTRDVSEMLGFRRGSSPPLKVCAVSKGGSWNERTVMDMPAWLQRGEVALVLLITRQE